MAAWTGSAGVTSGLSPEQQAMIAASGIKPGVNNFSNMGNMTGSSTVDAQTGAVNTARNNALAQEYQTKLQGFAKSNGDKNLFTQLGGQVDPNDPWGFYRESAGNTLSGFIGAEDPSNVYRNKLQEMSTGQFNPDDPSYQWRFDQGQQAVERSLAARGLLDSGNAGIELQEYGQGMASQEYAAQFGRMLQGLSGVSDQYNSQFNRLAQMAGVDLNPAASGQLMNQAVGNANQARAIKNDYSVQQQKLGMYSAYNEGIASQFQPQGGNMNTPAYSNSGGGYLQGGA
jgi:hypothetical protein